MSASSRHGRAPCDVARAALGALTLALVLTSSREARADDGVFGRFDGDLELSAGLGAQAQLAAPALYGELSALYLSTAGVYATYAEAFGQTSARSLRSLAGGFRLAPLFLARWGTDLERGPGHADLLLDSFHLDLGAFWSDERPLPLAPGAGLSPEPGLELGLGIAVPFLSRATGPRLGLRAAARFRAIDLAGRGPGDLVESGAFVALTLRFHGVVKTGLVDVGDRAAR